MGSCDDVGAISLKQQSLQVLPTRTVYQFGLPNGLPFLLQVEFLAGVAPLNNASRLAVAPNYITVTLAGADDTTHAEVYFGIGGESMLHKGDGCAPNAPPQNLGWYIWNKCHSDIYGLDYISMQIGSTDQKPFGTPSSDRGTYPWGYLTLSTASDAHLSSYAALPLRDLVRAANSSAVLSSSMAGKLIETEAPLLALHWTAEPSGAAQQQFQAMITLDEGFVMQYYGLNLPPYWSYEFPRGMVHGVVPAFLADAAIIRQECVAADEEMLNAMQQRAGPRYAGLGGLAYRQVTASLSSAWHAPTQQRWVFMKEISSNGDISTVDVIFPASPLFLWQAPSLLWELMLPLLAYGSNQTWTPYNKPWAAHDLGTWPQANRDGNHMEGMPIEESGNMLLMLRALQLLDPALSATACEFAAQNSTRVLKKVPRNAQSTLRASVHPGSRQSTAKDASGATQAPALRPSLRVTPSMCGDTPTAEPSAKRERLPFTGSHARVEGAFLLRAYQPLLEQWAQYLIRHLPDPSDQLCTDDFKGNVASNANLAVKGILGLAAYADILHTWGDVAAAEALRNVAKGYASQWEALAAVTTTTAGESSISHYRMEVVEANKTVQHTESWSMKYNLFMQDYLGLDVFSESVIRTEVAYYMSKMKPFGIPLDYISSSFTKSDWLMMVAAMSPQSMALKLVDALADAMETMVDRVPFTDLYDVSTGRLPANDNQHLPHFFARPVMGCLWSLMLTSARPDDLMHS